MNTEKVKKIKIMEKSAPTISVIIPAFNAQETIHETIMSVLGQSFTNFELLVIDDASTDSTKKLLTI